MSRGNANNPTNLKLVIKKSTARASKLGQKNNTDDLDESGDASDQIDKEENEDNGEDYDDSQTFTSNTKSNEDSQNATLNNNLKMKQITKIISPKWPNRVYAFELIRRIIKMCSQAEDERMRTAHFDLLIAKKLKQQQQKSQPANLIKNQPKDQFEDNYLILFLQDLMRIACIGATNNCDPLKLVGLDLLHDLIVNFGSVEESNPEFKGHLILEQYQAQVSAALRPQFSIETSAHVTAKACQVCSVWICSGVARDLNDLRRIHQLLLSSLQKLNGIPAASTTLVESSFNAASPSQSTDTSLIYSELSLTVEKLAVLRAWAEVYIVAFKKNIDKMQQQQQQPRSNSITSLTQNNNKNSTESLLSLVKPELKILSHHWSIALKDYAFLCLPNEYACQLPIEGGAFYHADLVESSKPIYKEHFTKILLAYAIWLNEMNFGIREFSAVNTKIKYENKADQEIVDEEKESEELKEKLFFMLLGLSLETLSNTTGLAQLSEETIENILESINYLLKTRIARNILMKKNVYLCVEILSILYK